MSTEKDVVFDILAWIYSQLQNSSSEIQLVCLPRVWFDGVKLRGGFLVPLAQGSLNKCREAPCCPVSHLNSGRKERGNLGLVQDWAKGWLGSAFKDCSDHSNLQWHRQICS